MAGADGQSCGPGRGNVAREVFVASCVCGFKMSFLLGSYVMKSGLSKNAVVIVGAGRCAGRRSMPICWESTPPCAPKTGWGNGAKN
jgi:hypothetical protein